MSVNLIISSPVELYQLISEAVSDVLSKQVKEPPMASKSEYFTLAQACEYLHIAPQTMYGLTSRRKIKFIKVTKKLLFTQSDLDEFLSNGKRETKGYLGKNLSLSNNKGGANG